MEGKDRSVEKWGDVLLTLEPNPRHSCVCVCVCVCFSVSHVLRTGPSLDVGKDRDRAGTRGQGVGRGQPGKVGFVLHSLTSAHSLLPALVQARPHAAPWGTSWSSACPAPRGRVFRGKCPQVLGTVTAGVHRRAAEHATPKHD